MQLVKKWSVPLLFMGWRLLATMNVADLRIEAAEQLPKGDHWQNFDGHWNYWHEADHRWYYTDGSHWYYHNGTNWVLYDFNKVFGTIGFLLGGYKPPPPPTVVVPRHDVWRHP